MNNYDDMHLCFAGIKEKVNKALDDTNLDLIFKTLDSIKEPTLVTGVGGSSIVASFLAKVLREKNNIIATFALPRDLEYMNLNGYKNVIAVSYSGNNAGVDASLDNNLNKYLFTGHAKDNVNNLVYTMPEENSYVSISATIVPMSIILMYYKNDRTLINNILDSTIETTSNNMHYEAIYGYEDSTAAIMLESSFIESGMASIVLHEKYNYAHGRINIIRHNNADLIYFKSHNEYDGVLSNTLPSIYKNIITIEKKYDDMLVNDYYETQLCLKLIGKIADNKNTSISQIEEYPENNIFYLYKGAFK